MMKRLLLVAFIALVATLTIKGNDWLGQAEAEWPEFQAKAVVMLNADTGEWLYAGNGDKALPPASMSKMMTELLILEDVREGRLRWEDAVEASDYAANAPGAEMRLKAGQSYTVEELFAAMTVHSANDAAVALAERSAGSEAEFVERMNAKAREIGLSKKTAFGNATGLSRQDLLAFAEASSAKDTVMTAKDVALLARHLITSFPEIVRFTTESAAPGPGENAGETVRLQTTNEMLPGQRFGTAGNDGLKTGYTESAGYCFTGSFLRGGERYITVVMGTETPEARFEETAKLLDAAWGKEGTPG
ncbi:D-alanyl-D-alanine carboxypeptidase family protein [Cohnella algarum]|uniref:D-alanyl-D-alanine carboxypeptidase family protein n=1 Tax=Cohnella algarum TaxID=2044859 RepID=UPI001F07AFBD|nr:D-alanyl-D-alanine carboxypeptidase family protein [Cohnella algarum]